MHETDGRRLRHGERLARDGDGARAGAAGVGRHTERDRTVPAAAGARGDGDPRAPLLAVQAQPAPADTATVPVPPDAAIEAFDGPTGYVQRPGADPWHWSRHCGGSAVPRLRNGGPLVSQDIAPIRRSLAGLGAMLTRTVAAPLPLTGVANEIQLASVATVHEQALIVDTATSRVSPRRRW